MKAILIKNGELSDYAIAPNITETALGAGETKYQVGS